jgi:hypothetical protein
VQVKNKPCMIYILMRLIPWKQSHGSETMTTGTGQLDKKRSIWIGQSDGADWRTGQLGLDREDWAAWTSKDMTAVTGES